MSTAHPAKSTGYKLRTLRMLASAVCCSSTTVKQGSAPSKGITLSVLALRCSHDFVRAQEISHLLLAACVAAGTAVASSSLVLPSLAGDEFRTTIARTVRGLGFSLSG